MPDQQLLDNQASLNSLAEAHIVRNEEVYPCHVDGSHEWVKLIVLNGDAAAERCLEERAVRVGCCAPAHRIKESFQPVIRVPAGDLRQPGLFKYLRTRLKFPNHLKLFPQRILIQRGERDEMLRTRPG